MADHNSEQTIQDMFRDNEAKALADWTEVDERIAKRIHDWPALYSNRTTVLFHWFAVYGNGMKWYRGRLIDLYEGAPSEHVPVLATVAYRLSEVLYEFRRRESRALAKTSAGYMAAHECRFYAGFPIDREYSHLCRVPDDVRPEWLSACRETCVEIFTYKPGGLYRDDLISEAREVYKNNVTIADEMLKQYAERFGPHPLWCNSYQDFVDRMNECIKALKETPPKGEENGLA